MSWIKHINDRDGLVQPPLPFLRVLFGDFGPPSPCRLRAPLSHSRGGARPRNLTSLRSHASQRPPMPVVSFTRVPPSASIPVVDLIYHPRPRAVVHFLATLSSHSIPVVSFYHSRPRAVVFLPPSHPSQWPICHPHPQCSGLFATLAHLPLEFSTVHRVSPRTLIPSPCCHRKLFYYTVVSKSNFWATSTTLLQVPSKHAH